MSSGPVNTLHLFVLESYAEGRYRELGDLGSASALEAAADASGDGVLRLLLDMAGRAEGRGEKAFIEDIQQVSDGLDDMLQHIYESSPRFSR